MTTSETTSVVLLGVGGQGILLASEVVARAAMLAGHRVKTNEVHGMAQRGGSVVAQIRYGAEVHSPLVPPGSARVLGAFEKIEALRGAGYLMPGGFAVVSAQEVIPVSVSSGQATYPEDADRRLRAVFANLALLDATGLAEEAGDIRAANIVILGGVSKALELPVEIWREALAACIAAKHVDTNLRAFETGRRFA